MWDLSKVSIRVLSAARQILGGNAVSSVQFPCGICWPVLLIGSLSSSCLCGIESGLRVSAQELRSNSRGRLLSTPGRGGCGVWDCETAYDHHARVFEVQCLTVLAAYREESGSAP